MSTTFENLTTFIALNWLEKPIRYWQEHYLYLKYSHQLTISRSCYLKINTSSLLSSFRLEPAAEADGVWVYKSEPQVLLSYDCVSERLWNLDCTVMFISGFAITFLVII